MIRALTPSATGLDAQSANIERISTDLANVNTDAYKRSRTEFKELFKKKRIRIKGQPAVPSSSLAKGTTYVDILGYDEGESV